MGTNYEGAKSPEFTVGMVMQIAPQI